MELRKLTKKEQLALFDEPNSVELVKEYISYAPNFMKAAEYKLLAADPVKNAFYLRRYEKPTDPVELQILEKMSLEDAKDLRDGSHGILCSEALIKMIDVMPYDVAKEIMVAYAKSCDIREEVLLVVIDDFENKEDIRDVLVAVGFISGRMMRKISDIFTREELKAFLLELIETDAVITQDVQWSILVDFGKKDAKEIFEKAIDHDICLKREVINCIMCTFSKKMQKELLTKYFNGCGKEHYEAADIFDIMHKIDA